MVAEGIQRQKTMEKQANNNIRGNYMDRLGVNNPRSDSRGTSDMTTMGGSSSTNFSNRNSNVSADTYQFDSSRRSQNLVISKDRSAPRETGRTTIQLNQTSD